MKINGSQSLDFVFVLGFFCAMGYHWHFVQTAFSTSCLCWQVVWYLICVIMIVVCECGSLHALEDMVVSVHTDRREIPTGGAVVLSVAALQGHR